MVHSERDGQRRTECWWTYEVEERGGRVSQVKPEYLLSLAPTIILVGMNWTEQDVRIMANNKIKMRKYMTVIMHLQAELTR